MKSIMKVKMVMGCIIASLTLFPTISLAQKANMTSDPVLIFQTGYEGTSRVVQDLGTNDYGALYEHITGIDNMLPTKNDWEKDWREILSPGVMSVQYTGGDSSRRFAKIIPEPGNPSNHVLYFWLNDSWAASEGQEKARIQTNIYGAKTGFKEFYQSQRMYLHPDFNTLRNYPQKITWLTLAEFWNNEWWSAGNKNGFRFSVSICKQTEGEGDLRFKSDSQDLGMKEVWKEVNTNITVPIGKWFTLEYYFKEGNKENGRFYVAITPEGEPKQVLFDIKGFTHNTSDLNPDGMTDFNPQKLYTSKELVGFMKSQGKTLQIYWDDFKLWTNKRP